MTALVNTRWLAVLLFSSILTVLPACSVFAANSPVDLSTGQIQVWEDPSTETTLEQLLTQDHQFTVLTTTSPNFGFTRSAYWLRIPVQNQRAETTTYYLNLQNPLLSEITLYHTYNGTVREQLHSGSAVPGTMRPYPATTHVLPFQLAPDEAAILYVRVYSNGMTLFMPFAIINEVTLQRSVIFGWLLNSAVLSILGALLLYNAFVCSLLQSRLYLYYVLHLLFRLMIVTGTGGAGRGLPLSPQYVAGQSRCASLDRALTGIHDSIYAEIFGVGACALA